MFNRFFKGFAGPAGLAVFIATLSLAACGGDDEESQTPEGNAASPAIALVAKDFSFEPASLSIQPGQEVTIEVENVGKAPHTFTVDSLGVDVNIAPGEKKDVSVTSPEPGSLEFYCRYHRSGGMTGALSVGQGSAAGLTKSSDSRGYYGY